MKTRQLAVLLGGFCILGSAQNSNFGVASNLQPSTVAALPAAASAPNGIRHVTDGNSATDCTVGGGSTKVTCISNGSTWAAAGGGGGSGDVTHTGTLTSGKAIIGNGSADVTVSSETGVLRASSGTLSGAELSGVVVTSASNVTTPGKVDVMQSSWFCLDAGSTDDYACNLSPAATAYVTGAHYWFKAATANTTAATINLNSLGAKTIKKVAGGITTDLASNDIRLGQWVDLVYDGTNMQMQSTLGNAPSGSITGTDTQVLFFDGANSPAGDAGMTYNKTTDSLTLAGTLTANSVTFTSLLINGGGAGSLTQTYANTATNTAAVWPTISAGGNVTLSTGTLTSGNVAKFDSSGRVVDAGVVPAGYIMTLVNTSANATNNDATTYYIGQSASASTIYNNVRFYVPKACTVKTVAYTYFVAGTAPSNESYNVDIFQNGANQVTGSQVSFASTAIAGQAQATGITFALAAGDYIAGRIITPTWGTNPTNVTWRADVYCE